MVLYQGTKRLFARPFCKQEYCDLRGWKVPENEEPNEDGYLVEYVDGGGANVEGFDGYVSWTPLDVFVQSYRPVTAMTFGAAIEALKTGERVARVGWNGKGMFVYLVPAASYPVQTGAAKAHFGEGAMVPYRAYLALKTVDEDVATWAPSCADVLAEDWELISAEK